jgi:hypothetical protein
VRGEREREAVVEIVETEVDEAAEGERFRPASSSSKRLCCLRPRSAADLARISSATPSLIYRLVRISHTTAARVRTCVRGH